MKILLIGSYPPPLGGVGVFVKRYARKLSGEGHTVEVLDPTQLPKRVVYARLAGARAAGYDLVSLNFPSFHMMMMLLLTGMASRTEVWEHNWRVLETWSAWRRRLYALFLRRALSLVLVAPHLKDYYARHGVGLPPRTRVEHAFLPPPLEEEAQVVATYGPETRRFVETRRPLLVANAFRVVAHGGVDLYGLDMCVELVAALRETYPRVGLVFALGEFADADYRRRIEQRIAELNLHEHIHFLTGQREIWPLFRRAALMVRPTVTDGYAVSLAEARYFGCAAVASDAAERPAGTHVFVSRDQQDFLRKCRAALDAAHASRQENSTP